MAKLLGRLVLVAVAALFGLVVGCFGGCGGSAAQQSTLADYVPLPHHVPEHKGGVSLRFAMAHDVIHERFPKHGPAHYRERNRLTREKLAKLTPDDPATFPLADDLGAGLDRLGQAKEAAVILRDKLVRQRATGLSGRDLYTSYANLGTFLCHDSLAKAIAGDADAKKRFREGLDLVRKSVEVNPEAHFGRERWQVVFGEFLLAAMDKPDILKTFDFLGNRLDLGIQSILTRKPFYSGIYGRPNNHTFSPSELVGMIPKFFEPGSLDDPSRWSEVVSIRSCITSIGAEDSWGKVAVPSHRKPVPFDEPTLAIIGIWRQGSGANPHFALALGEAMLRVGQRYIAWEAYERASRMAGRFSPDPSSQQFLRDHCGERQRQIEETLSFQPQADSDDTPWQLVSPPPSLETVAGLRPAFEAELAYGEGYQRVYQEYEAKRIAAGVPITDEHFFDDFHAGRDPIASPVGPEDWYAYVPDPFIMRPVREATPVGWAWGVFGAGLAAMATALLFRWKDRRAERIIAPAETTGLPADPPLSE